MARLVSKLSGLIALLSTASMLTGCETSAGRPELCRPGVSKARCAKVTTYHAKPASESRDRGSRNY